MPVYPALLAMSLGPPELACPKSGYRTKNGSEPTVSHYSRGDPQLLASQIGCPRVSSLEELVIRQASQQGVRAKLCPHFTLPPVVNLRVSRWPGRAGFVASG
ncbi:hypothetical protein NDU88_004727 [Pleurodeles waltl]|uniref:Uncharacterized protein n=1 Tax=Pleurodeles waltl TaxID=8319 RepID=A0AAV7MEU1_PLEWA|nr:hypothetical protein NDU88_004727 [Pleurodeles waltl]